MNHKAVAHNIFMCYYIVITISLFIHIKIDLLDNNHTVVFVLLERPVWPKQA